MAELEGQFGKRNVCVNILLYIINSFLPIVHKEGHTRPSWLQGLGQDPYSLFWGWQFPENLIIEQARFLLRIFSFTFLGVITISFPNKHLAIVYRPCLVIPFSLKHIFINIQRNYCDEANHTTHLQLNFE